MLFNPELDISYVATLSDDKTFQFTVLDNKVPTRVKIETLFALGGQTVKELFIGVNGEMSDVVETTFTIMEGDSQVTEAVYTPGGDKVTTPYIKSVDYVYKPKAGQIWSVGDLPFNILILEDTNWPLKCIYYDAKTIDAKTINGPNYLYLGHDMKLYNKNSMLNGYTYCNPHVVNANTDTIYIVRDNAMLACVPEKGSMYDIGVGVNVLFTGVGQFPMEYEYSDTCNKRLVSPIGFACLVEDYYRNVCFAATISKFNVIPNVNEMVTDPKQFGKYEFMYKYDSRKYQAVMVTTTSFKYLDSLCKGEVRTIENGIVYDDDMDCGKIDSSKFIGIANELVENPVVNGIYDICTSGLPHRIVLLSKTTDGLFYFQYLDGPLCGLTYRINKDWIICSLEPSNIANPSNKITSSIFIEMNKATPPTVTPLSTWEAELQDLIAKENEQKDKMKQLDDQIAKEDEEYNNLQKKYYESRANLQNSQRDCKTKIDSLWGNSKPHVQYKEVCTYLFGNYYGKESILKNITLTTVAKDHLIKMLEKQLDCSIFLQRESVLENIRLTKTIPVKDE
uniref:Uncharacterized protein n=1 Tax=viral metagenome TaxID=1070528 RepID=A0A6C0JVM0_9ZZZZ